VRYFEQEEIARRYAAYRPQVQADILREVAAALGWRGKVGAALDVACGTGHSTAPLRAYAERVSGCDLSEAMLGQARAAFPDLTFQLAPAEALPAQDGALDLITVGFAFHWFDQPAFLAEVRRALKPGGYLVLYNMWFPNIMEGNPAYADWHEGVYLARYPSPQRQRTPLAEMLAAEAGLEPGASVALSVPLRFSLAALRHYLTTQSNIAAALERGETLAEVDAWLEAELRPYFSQPVHTFRYLGQAEVVRRAWRIPEQALLRPRECE
jgi:SAM-dependent methyltransferase